MNIVQDHISKTTKEFQHMKNEFRLEYFSKKSIEQKVKEVLGLIEPIQEDGEIRINKLAFRHSDLSGQDHSIYFHGSYMLNHL